MKKKKNLKFIFITLHKIYSKGKQKIFKKNNKTKKKCWKIVCKVHAFTSFKSQVKHYKRNHIFFLPFFRHLFLKIYIIHKNVMP